MKKRIIIGLVAVIAITGVSVFFLSSISGASPTGTTPSYSGIIQQTEYNLSFKIAGRIADLNVSEGDTVNKGDILGKLEDAEWLTKVQQAEAAVEIAGANVDKASQGVGLTQNDIQAKIAQAQAAVGMAEAKYAALQSGARPEQIQQLENQLNVSTEALEQAKENMQRISQLYEQNAIPKVKVDEAKLQLEQIEGQHTNARLELEIAQQGARQEELEAAKQQVEQAKAVLEEAQNGTGKVGISQTDVRLAQGTKKQAEANLAEARTYLQYTNLVAPIDGTVISVSGKVSDLASAGYTVVTLADTKDKWVEFYVPEDQIATLTVGKEIPLYIPAINQQVKGNVVYVNPAPSFAVKKATNYLNEQDIRSFMVKVALPEVEDYVYAGMTVQWSGEDHHEGQ